MNFINGNWVEGKGKRFSSLNPIDNTFIYLLLIREKSTGPSDM